jgi:soluble lytic murein transglycosylase-like protein
MRGLEKLVLVPLLCGLLAGCTIAGAAAPQGRPLEAIEAAAPATPLDGLISEYSAYYEVPESLVRRVIVRESNYNPGARNGPYWGLMQISHPTARSMGYTGSASGLLDAETNLKYAVKYLRGAYLVAQGNPDRAVRFYASGYYYDARNMGLLDEVGLR